MELVRFPLATIRAHGNVLKRFGVVSSINTEYSRTSVCPTRYSEHECFESLGISNASVVR